MKRSIAILFLLLFMSTSSGLLQYLKIPMLVHHYLDHKYKDKSTTLKNFFAMHYLHGDVKDDDHQEDSQLPFKSQINIGISANTIVPIFHHTITPSDRIELTPYIICDFEYSGETVFNDIWQPPKC